MFTRPIILQLHVKKSAPASSPCLPPALYLFEPLEVLIDSPSHTPRVPILTIHLHLPILQMARPAEETLKDNGVDVRNREDDEVWGRKAKAAGQRPRVVITTAKPPFFLANFTFIMLALAMVQSSQASSMTCAVSLPATSWSAVLTWSCSQIKIA